MFKFCYSVLLQVSSNNNRNEQKQNIKNPENNSRAVENTQKK